MLHLTRLGAALCCVLLIAMGSSLLAQTTGSVNPKAAPVEPSVKQDDLPPGGCLPNWVGRGRRLDTSGDP